MPKLNATLRVAYSYSEDMALEQGIVATMLDLTLSSHDDPVVHRPLAQVLGSKTQNEDVGAGS